MMSGLCSDEPHTPNPYPGPGAKIRDEPRGRPRPVADGLGERHGGEIMTSNVIERAKGSGTLAASGGVERTFSMVRASRYARDLQRRAQEDAAIDAEDI